MERISAHFREHPENLALLVIFIFTYGSQANWFPFGWPISMFITFIGSVGIIFLLFRTFWWPEKIILILAYGHFVYATISNFASKYMELGLMSNGVFSLPNKSEALYFSVVTFTTLGYGDYQPSKQARLWAQYEALIGYVMLGLFIALLIKVFSPTQPQQDN